MRETALAMLVALLGATAAAGDDSGGLLSAAREPFAEACEPLVFAARERGLADTTPGDAERLRERGAPEVVRLSERPGEAIGRTYRKPAFEGGASPALAMGVALAGSFLLDDWAEDEMREDFRSDDAGDAAKWAQRIGHDAALVSVLGLYAFGDEYDEDTAAMATSAVFTATAGSQGLKLATGRARMNTRDAGEFGGPLDLDRDSFPSGHTAAAVAVATVYGRRYPKYRWAFYAAAAGVGWARMQRERHFLSDVIGGAALGYYSGRKALANEEGILTIRW